MTTKHPQLMSIAYDIENVAKRTFIAAHESQHIRYNDWTSWGMVLETIAHKLGHCPHNFTPAIRYKRIQETRADVMAALHSPAITTGMEIGIKENTTYATAQGGTPPPTYLSLQNQLKINQAIKELFKPQAEASSKLAEDKLQGFLKLLENLLFDASEQDVKSNAQTPAAASTATAAAGTN